MLSATASSVCRASAQQQLRLLPALSTAAARASHAVVVRNSTTTPRFFTAASPVAQRVLPVEPEPAWPHPLYSAEQMRSIQIAHRNATNWSDWMALAAVRLLRWSFDVATGYKHDKQVSLGKKDAGDAVQKFAMTPERWMIRFIFLESIAGVPGMVAGMVRHLHSLRKLRRDNGWIETLFEEAYNERLHLLTFLKLREPGWFMRLSILGAQGVFFNAFFITYLLSPRTCHRFVGYLEEEAVITYSRAIAELEAGKLPEWETLAAPDVAIHYFKLPKDAKMIDVLYHIRADEAKHREVNHTLANLKQNSDPNPYTAIYEKQNQPRPTKTLEWVKPTGWERSEVSTNADVAKA